MIFIRSIRHALRGIRYTFEHERNFRIHIVIALIVITLAITLQVSPIQWLFIITAIASVLALEIVNTVFEKVVDMFQPRVHEYAAIIKDLMAAAVLVASLSALIVGSLIFIPLLITRLF
ncbi:MAG: diacylglycerol kinase family protein [Candidatus Kerfeldbacteria bacterium]